MAVDTALKALNRESACLKYIREGSTIQKEAAFVEKQFRKLIRDSQFLSTMMDEGRNKWLSFSEVI